MISNPGKKKYSYQKDNEGIGQKVFLMNLNHRTTLWRKCPLHPAQDVPIIYWKK